MKIGRKNDQLKAESERLAAEGERKNQQNAQWNEQQIQNQAQMAKSVEAESVTKDMSTNATFVDQSFEKVLGAVTPELQTPLSASISETAPERHAEGEHAGADLPTAIDQIEDSLESSAVEGISSSVKKIKTARIVVAVPVSAPCSGKTFAFNLLRGHLPTISWARVKFIDEGRVSDADTEGFDVIVLIKSSDEYNRRMLDE
jgi:hypothetical protein